MTNTLQPLPFDHHALEPNMSATTLSFHHGKHLATYLDNVNRMVKDTPMEAYPLEKICREAEGALLNNAAQAWNHLFFFEQLAPNPNQPSANMRHRLETAFDSMEQFIVKQKWFEKNSSPYIRWIKGVYSHSIPV